MFTNREQAEAIIRMYLEMGAEIDRSVAEIMRSAPDDEFQRYRRAAGRIMAEMLLSVINPIVEVHPDLIPAEMDRRSEKPSHDSGDGSSGGS